MGQFPSAVLVVGIAAVAGFLSLIPLFGRFRWQLRWSSLLFVICGAVLLADANVGFLRRISPNGSQQLRTVLAMTLWFAGALFGSAFLKFAMRRWLFPDETQPHARKLFADLLCGLLYLIAGIGMLNTAVGPSVSGMLATSGIVAVVVGLALQSTLSDLFSGIALNLERPAHAGDWISLAGAEGQILEINWRATRLRTRAGDLIVIPNSVLSKSVVTNHYWSSTMSVTNVAVTFAHEIDPDICQDLLLAAARSVDLALNDPAPSVSLLSSGLLGITYQLSLHIADYLDASAVTSRALHAIWSETKKRGIVFATPHQEIFLEPTRELRPAWDDTVMSRRSAPTVGAPLAMRSAGSTASL